MNSKHNLCLQIALDYYKSLVFTTVSSFLDLNQIFEAVVDRLTMVKQNQLSYRLFTYIQSFPSLQLTLSLGVLHRLIEAMYNEKSLDMDVVSQNLSLMGAHRNLG